MRLNGRLRPADQFDFVAASAKFENRLKQPKELELSKTLDDAILHLSTLISPIDPRTFEPIDIDEFKHVRHALAIGAMLGHHLNLYAYQPMVILSDEITKNILEFRSSAREVPDNISKVQYLIDSSTDAVKGMGDTVHDWIVSYEERAVNDIRMQRYVRVGCGVITIATRRAFDNALEEYHKKDFELFEEELVADTHIDWDAVDWSKETEG